MLVAGVHFQEDLAGEEDSWKLHFQDRGVEVVVEERSLGGMPGIIDRFGQHVQDALAVIPDSTGGADTR
jgi:sirohydrochlorin cobaltochelatase